MEHFNQPHMSENSLHPSSPHPPLRQDSKHDSSVSRKDHDDKPAKTVEVGKSDEAQKTGFAKFFSGISWVQILSGGLAAVTVFLLSARLGFAGTIVGAALASMISTFSSQFFQNILNESEKKIKKVAKSIPSTSSSSEPEDVSHTPRVASNIAVVRAQEEQITQMEPPLPSVAEANGSLHRGKGSTGSSEDTSTISSTSLMPPLPSSPSGSSHQSQQSDVNAPAQQTASAKHRKTVILSLVATLISVVLVAGGILLMTHGKGTGPVVPSTRIEKSGNSKRAPEKQSTTPSQNSGSTSTQDPNKGTDNNSDSQSSQSQSQVPSQSQSDQNANSGSSSSNSNDSNSSSDSSGVNSEQSNNGSSSSDSDSTDKSSSSDGSDKSKDKTDSSQDTDSKNSSQSSTGDSSQKDKSPNNSNDQSSANNSSSK
jgi:hypothetical protein